MTSNIERLVRTSWDMKPKIQLQNLLILTQCSQLLATAGTILLVSATILVSSYTALAYWLAHELFQLLTCYYKLLRKTSAFYSFTVLHQRLFFLCFIRIILLPIKTLVTSHSFTRVLETSRISNWISDPIKCLLFPLYYAKACNEFTEPMSVSLRPQATQPRMAVRYGTFKICVLRTSHLQPYRTSVQFLKRTVPTYRTRTITKNAYRTS